MKSVHIWRSDPRESHEKSLTQEPEGRKMYVSGIKTAMSQMHKSLLIGGLQGRQIIEEQTNKQDHV